MRMPKCKKSFTIEILSPFTLIYINYRLANDRKVIKSGLGMKQKSVGWKLYRTMPKR